MLHPTQLYKKGLIDDPNLIFMGEKSLSYIRKLENDENINDRIIEQQLYGATENNEAFRKLKSRYKKKIIDEIFHGTFEKYNSESRNHVYVFLMKQYAVALALKLGIFHKAYLTIIKEIHAKATKYDLPVILQFTVLELYYYYAFVNPNKKLMMQYLKEKETILQKVIVVTRSRIINGEVSYIYMKEKFNPSKANKLLIRDRVEELIDLCLNIDDFSVTSMRYDLGFYYLMVEKKYDQILTLCEEAEVYYDKKQISDKSFKWGVETNRIYALIYLRRFTDGSQQIEATLSWMTPGVRVWFHICYYQFICFALMLDIEKAADVIIKAITQKNIKLFHDDLVQWEARYILFSLLISEEQILKKLNQIEYKLTPQQFLRKHQDLLKDKKSMNLTYRIVEIVFYIKTNKYNNVIDIIENLGQFKYKYLRDNETFRAQCFIRLLEVLAKSNFHPVRTNYLAEPILKKMKTKATVIDTENIFAEILPFEDMWNRILKLL